MHRDQAGSFSDTFPQIFISSPPEAILPPIAVHEAAKDVAFSLAWRGYTQSHKSLACPICGTKYLLLLDDRCCPRRLGSNDAEQRRALEYFALRIREAHDGGHSENSLVMMGPEYSAAGTQQLVRPTALV